MLQSIRSPYILKIIIANIKEDIKLKALRYNKKLQNNLGLTLTDFKRLSGKYIIKIGDDKIEEHDGYTNRLLFEGEYSNGKKNGEGIEYNEKGNLIFKGEYFDGRKWKGIGKKYDEDTEEMILEYEYSNGKIDGKASEYDKFNKELLFSGNYYNGKRNGYGKEYKYIPAKNSDSGFNRYNSNTSENISKRIEIFEGEYLNGERKKGKEYNYENQIVYEGGYLKGKRNGYGILYTDYCNRLGYKGEFLNGKKHGNGIELDILEKTVYKGEFSNGKKNGKGKEYYYLYNANYYHDSDGETDTIFEGEYLNNYRYKGKEYYQNGKLKFEGEYLFKKKWKGKLYDYYGNVIFELKGGNAIVEDKDYSEVMKIYIGDNLDEKKLKGIVEGKEYDKLGIHLLFDGEYSNKEK